MRSFNNVGARIRNVPILIRGGLGLLFFLCLLMYMTQLTTKLHRSAMSKHFSVLEDQNLIAFANVADLMSHDDHCIIDAQRTEAVIEDFLRHLRVNSRNRIIEHIDLGLRVESSCEGQSGLLTTR
jgi:hypothetical protein